MSQIKIKSAEEIERIRAASQVTAQILDALHEFVVPAISTEDINTFVHNMMMEFGVTPATLGYHGFPKSVCTSVNEVVCHGIPSPLQTITEGDIINVDVTCIKDGFHGDASRMYFVGGEGAVSDEAKTLVDVTKQALQVGIDAVKPGNHIGDIGADIQAFIEGLEHEYGIVREYTGHGIGRDFHEAPQVIHVGKKGSGPEMKPGMTFTVEPMINLGTHKTALSRMDGWTVRTADGKLSAQWEHTVLVTDSGNEKLTQSPGGFEY